MTERSTARSILRSDGLSRYIYIDPIQLRSTIFIRTWITEALSGVEVLRKEGTPHEPKAPYDLADPNNLWERYGGTQASGFGKTKAELIGVPCQQERWTAQYL